LRREAVAGRGGASVVYTRPGYGCCHLSGYTLAHCFTALAAVAAGVPWVDTRPVTDIGALIGAPMIACGMKADPPPWHGLSHAPLAKVFAYHRKFGAVTGNETEPLAEHDETDYLGGRRGAA
jgi:hypothetical protein